MAGKGGRSRPSAGGPKTLLTTLALLGTFGGWAYFAAEGAADSEPVPTPEPVVLDLPPIPTIVPSIDPVDVEEFKAKVEPTPTPALRSVNEPASSSSSGGGGGGGGSAGRSRSSR